MNRGFDSHFGPPSQPINVKNFIQEAHSAFSRPLFWDQLSQEEQRGAPHVQVEVAASISELKSSLEEVWDNPILSAHLLRQHESTVASVYGQADAPAPKGRKRKRLIAPEGIGSAPGVSQLQQQLDSVNLKCWELTVESALCMRPAKNSDYNALDRVKKTGSGALRTTNHADVGAARSTSLDSVGSPTPDTAPYEDVVISLTIYNRIPYLPSCVTRSSQHAVLSTQTLDDLVRAVPCVSSRMPVEKLDAQGNITGYSFGDQGEQHSGYSFCIESIVYEDERDNTDHGEDLMAYFEKLPKDKRSQIKKAATSAGETTFNMLTLRLHQPYWMVHQGNCEHFVVVDQIRLAHASDPPSGYPLMLHLTPTLQGLCRACSKVPAVYSIVGDMRLGESPCLLCAPCWRTMGPPKNEEDVIVIPLVIR